MNRSVSTSRSLLLSIDRSLYPLIVAIAQLTIWVMHIYLKLPPGAAIPELVSVISFIPFYTRDYLRMGSVMKLYSKSKQY